MFPANKPVPRFLWQSEPSAVCRRQAPAPSYSSERTWAVGKSRRFVMFELNTALCFRSPLIAALYHRNMISNNYSRNNLGPPRLNVRCILRVASRVTNSPARVSKSIHDVYGLKTNSNNGVNKGKFARPSALLMMQVLFYVRSRVT